MTITKNKVDQRRDWNQLNLERSISNLSKRIERFDSFDDDGNDSNCWKGKAIIPLNDWIQFRGTPNALQYFPHDFDNPRTFLTESKLKNSDVDIEDVDTIDLHVYIQTVILTCILNL
jgi:hypothetical protein